MPTLTEPQKMAASIPAGDGKKSATPAAAIGETSFTPDAPSGTAAAANLESALDEKFQKGVAISVWQNCGGERSNWGRFTERTGGCCDMWPTVMDRASPNGGGSGFWDRYPEDIQLAKELGVNAFRLSLEWHRIEPEHKKIDMEAVKKYHAIFDACEAAGMKINCTLHHFVHPAWFEDKGAFEKQENIADFVAFATFAAREFGRRIKLWATFNEPTCCIFSQYFIGVHPPGRFMHFQKMGTVLHNILMAHADACNAMKALPGCDDLKIGMVHHHVEFMPSSPAYWWVRPACWWANFWWGRDTVLQFMLTGKFEWFVPLWGKTIDYQGPKPVCDWWGVNYYARGVVSPFFTPSFPEGEVMTDMKYTLYPRGLYQCFVRGSQLGVPMYVTEIGCADKSEDDHVRMTHVESFTNQIFKAIKDGFDVRGVYYWTLLDNFEWNCGYLMKFGLYYWAEGNPGYRNRTLKPGGRLLAQIYQTIPTNMHELKKHCQQSSREAGTTEYEAKLEESQKGLKLLPVVWNKGRTVGAQPMSKLANKIGLHDVEEQDVFGFDKATLAGNC